MKVLSLLNREFLETLGSRNPFDGALAYIQPHEAVKIARGMFDAERDGPILTVKDVLNPWKSYPVRGIRIDFEGALEWKTEEVEVVCNAFVEASRDTFYPASIPVGPYRLRYGVLETCTLVDADLYPKKQNAARQQWNQSRAAREFTRASWFMGTPTIIPTTSPDITDQGVQARAATDEELGILFPDAETPGLLSEYSAVAVWARWDNDKPEWQGATIDRLLALVERIRAI